MSDSANTDGANVASALGTLIGYVGAEAATDQIFERTLWPQRFWNHLTLKNAVLVAFIMPMGGPLHKAALATLDVLFEHGIFKGDSQGSMLGTGFYRDSKFTYTPWVNGEAKEKKEARNCLWVRAIGLIGIPETNTDKSVEAGVNESGPIRAKTTLSHLVLEAQSGMAKSKCARVTNDTGPCSLAVYTFLTLSEATGIAVGIVVATVWRSWFAFLWFAPLMLKLLCAATAVPRDGLSKPENTEKESSNKETRLYEIHDPHHGIIIIEGQEQVVTQFFRHYGHPIRRRFREILQIAIIVGFGFIFPIGLVASVLWMPLYLQYVWLGYQLYATLAMHIYRYANSHLWGTTEEAIALGFARSRDTTGRDIVELRDPQGQIVTATLSTTYYDKLKTAQKAAHKFLTDSRRPELTSADTGKTISSDD